MTLLTPFIFVVALMLSHWNIQDVDMIEPIRTIEMIDMKINDATMEPIGALWCGMSVDASGAYVALKELNSMHGDVDAASAYVASMEPWCALACGRW